MKVFHMDGHAVVETPLAFQSKPARRQQKRKEQKPQRKVELWGNKKLPTRGPKKGVFRLDQRYAAQCIYSKITSHAQAKLFISQYIAQVKEVSKLIYSFIKYNDDGGFADLSVKKEDIYFLFVHYQEGAIVGEPLNRQS